MTTSADGSTPAPAVSSAVIERIRATRLLVFDFDGVFTDNMVYVFEDGREAVRCSRADGLGLQKLARLGVASSILSTEVNVVVTARARKLKIDCVQGCEDKLLALQEMARERNLELSQIAFTGNDINDSCALENVGLPMVVADAHPDVVPHAIYQTIALGGHGAVREICDLFERVLGDG
jgi:YrbI family 3-deoxy-D-manno-octulosonate 8-phosphate phosphatase